MRNNGIVTGGTSGAGGAGYTGANGGDALRLGGGGTVINTALLRAGAAGNGDSNAGGIGAALMDGGTLTNRGTIIGGSGSSSGTGMGGEGGAGVYLNGGTLIDAGSISGGVGGVGDSGTGARGDAVQFGQSAATLVLYAGAVFRGAVAANVSAADTLALAGTAAGTLAGFGDTVTGFAVITEDAQASWTLGGTIAGSGVLSVGGHASLTLIGSVSIATLAFAGPGGVVSVGTPAAFTSTISGFGTGDVIDLGHLEALSLSYADNTLSLFGAHGNLVDTLHFAGDYVQSDFSLMADGNGGTKVIYAGPRESGDLLMFRVYDWFSHVGR